MYRDAGAWYTEDPPNSCQGSLSGGPRRVTSQHRAQPWTLDAQQRISTLGRIFCCKIKILSRGPDREALNLKNLHQRSMCKQCTTTSNTEGNQLQGHSCYCFVFSPSCMDPHALLETIGQPQRRSAGRKRLRRYQSKYASEMSVARYGPSFEDE